MFQEKSAYRAPAIRPIPLCLEQEVCTHGNPDVAFDANTEGGKKLYVQGGTLIAVGGLESGASITGSSVNLSTYSGGNGGGGPGGGGNPGGGGGPGGW